MFDKYYLLRPTRWQQWLLSLYNKTYPARTDLPIKFQRNRQTKVSKSSNHNLYVHTNSKQKQYNYKPYACLLCDLEIIMITFRIPILMRHVKDNVFTSTLLASTAKNAMMMYTSVMSKTTIEAGYLIWK